MWSRLRNKATALVRLLRAGRHQHSNRHSESRATSITYLTRPGGLSGDWVADNAHIVVCLANCTGLQGDAVSDGVFARWSYADTYSERRPSGSGLSASLRTRATPGQIAWRSPPSVSAAGRVAAGGGPAVVSAFAAFANEEPRRHRPDGQDLPLGDTQHARSLWFAECLARLSTEINAQHIDPAAPCHYTLALDAAAARMYTNELIHFMHSTPLSRVVGVEDSRQFVQALRADVAARNADVSRAAAGARRAIRDEPNPEAKAISTALIDALESQLTDSAVMGESPFADENTPPENCFDAQQRAAFSVALNRALDEGPDGVYIQEARKARAAVTLQRN